MVAAVVLFACDYSPTAPALPLTESNNQHDVTNLPIGAEIMLTIESKGCFHHVRDSYRLTRDDSGASLTLLGEQTNFDPDKLRWVVEPRITLEGLEDLQRVFDYYRHHEQQGTCTTIEHGWMQVMVNGEVVSTSTYTDSTCARLSDSAAPQGPPLGRVVKVHAS